MSRYREIAEEKVMMGLGYQIGGMPIGGCESCGGKCGGAPSGYKACKRSKDKGSNGQTYYKKYRKAGKKNCGKKQPKKKGGAMPDESKESEEMMGGVGKASKKCHKYCPVKDAEGHTVLVRKQGKPRGAQPWSSYAAITYKEYGKPNGYKYSEWLKMLGEEDAKNSQEYLDFKKNFNPADYPVKPKGVKEVKVVEKKAKAAK